MNRYSKLAYNSLITAFMSLVLLSPALAGIQCYSQDSYSSNFISAVQKELKAQGFYRGTVDGRWRNVSMILRHFFREITVEAFPPPVAPACVLLGRQAY
jgi:hypothetical protein